MTLLLLNINRKTTFLKIAGWVCYAATHAALRQFLGETLLRTRKFFKLIKDAYEKTKKKIENIFTRKRE